MQRHSEAVSGVCGNVLDTHNYTSAVNLVLSRELDEKCENAIILDFVLL